MKPAGPTAEIPMKLLVEQALQGDSQAFEALIERYRLRAFSVALRYTGHYDDASDVCQEALSRAWERLSHLHDPARFYSWLEQIVIHLSLDARRRSARQRQRTVPLDESMAVAGQDDEFPAVSSFGEAETTRSRVLDQEIATHLLRAIESLPETLREAAFLRFIEGLDSDAIARRLGIQPEAARKRVYRASLDLRRRLHPLYSELHGTGHER